MDCCPKLHSTIVLQLKASSHFVLNFSSNFRLMFLQNCSYKTKNVMKIMPTFFKTEPATNKQWALVVIK